MAVKVTGFCRVLSDSALSAARSRSVTGNHAATVQRAHMGPTMLARSTDETPCDGVCRHARVTLTDAFDTEVTPSVHFYVVASNKSVLDRAYTR